MSKVENPEPNFDRKARRDRRQRQIRPETLPSTGPLSNGTSATKSDLPSDEIAIEIRNRATEGQTIPKIASELGIRQIRVFACAYGMTHKHLNEDYPPLSSK